MAVAFVAVALPASAQPIDPFDDVGMSVQALALRCPTPESPRFRAFECNTVVPDVERTLLSDWTGMRRDLAARGVSPTLSYTGAWFANTSNPPREGSFGGGWHAALNVDFGKLAGATGWSAYVDLWWMQATGADAIFNTNLFPSNGNFVGNGFWIGQLYVQRTFGNGELTIAAGRLGPGAAFATLPVFASYVNVAINPNPGALWINDPSFTVPPPGAQWGVQALYSPTQSVQAAVGVFNNNPSSAAGADHGLDWSFRDGNRGVLAIAQLNWHRQQGARDAGLPGIYGIGAFVDSDDFATISGSPPTQRRKHGVYALAQQQVAPTCGIEGTRGLTLWGTVAYAGPSNVAPLPWYAAVGAVCQGPLRGRPNDVVAFGWIYGKPSDRFVPATATSQAVELNYQVTFTPAINVVLDAQYLTRLNGYPSRGTAVVGTQFSVTF